ncbi:MAG: hypothetical protein WAP98_04460 [Caldicoprobacterales bacterium]|nr:hypothetical protein [Bacillota bacterium]
MDNKTIGIIEKKTIDLKRDKRVVLLTLLHLSKCESTFDMLISDILST